MAQDNTPQLPAGERSGESLERESRGATLLRAAAALLVVGAIVIAMLACLGFRPGHVAKMLGDPATAHEAQPGAPPAGDKEPPKTLATADYAVIVMYLVAMLVIGIAVSGGAKTTRSFFIAEGKLHYLLVGLSLLGTYLSALTMMALSGMSYGMHDWTFVVQLPFLVLTAVVITRFVLPRYREAGVISVYEYLERRIHVSARLIASILFVIFSVGRMGLVLYLPALALYTVSGIPLPLCIAVTGAVITVYTVLGGIKAVIWTDAIQVLVIVAGAILTVIYVFADIGVGRFVEIGAAHHKFRWLVPSLDIAKITTLWLILETIFQTIRIYGTQQDMTQRFMAADSTARANRSVWISIVAYIPLGFIFYFLGTAFFVYYKVHADVPLPLKDDQAYPHYIAHNFPPGLAGLFIAAILAASMSTIDSLMNSSSTVCVEDFLKRFARRLRPDAYYLRFAQVLTVLWGMLAIGMAMLFIKATYAQIIWGKLMGILTNGMLGLMALAFLPFRVDKWAAGIGFAVSWAALFVMIAHSFDFPPFTWMAPHVPQINYLLWPVIGNTLCFVVALVLNPLFSRGHAGALPRQEALTR